MNNRPPTPRATRVGIAIGFAVIAATAVMSNAGAAVVLPVGPAMSAEQVDGSRVQPARVTPAETVAADER